MTDKKKVCLRANTDCRVKEGETQECWGSTFRAVEVPNPALKEEFHDDDEPKEILVLLAEFKGDTDEVKSLLSAKQGKGRRASRFEG